MKIFAANWKLQKNPEETRQFFSNFLKLDLAAQNQVVFFPSSICLEAASQSLKNSSVKFGAQNSYFEASGAFTGETSAKSVKDLGGSYILIGHSERRSLFGENDELISKKIKFVQSLDMTPMFCIGETLAERESGKTGDVLSRQIKEGLKHADLSKKIVVAYEPVWAIGTGKVATPEQVKETHAQVYEELKKIYGSSEVPPILYGGSVKADNATQLIQIPHVSGFLVGGASLEPASFHAICKA